MDGKYDMKLRITSYDVGPSRTLKPSSMLRIMQEVAGRHLEQDGLTYEFMRSKGIVFLLVKQAVKVSKLPRCEDDITAETWFESTKGAKFVRNMRFLGNQGEILIEAATLWIIADPRTHRILRPGAFPFKMPPVGGDTVNVEISRIILPDTARDKGIRAVRWSDIDCNNHMNNAVYADIICDYFPVASMERGASVNMELRNFQIDFNGEAALGDEISIKTAADAQGGAVFEGTIEGRRCFMASASLNAE